MTVRSYLTPAALASARLVPVVAAGAPWETTSIYVASPPSITPTLGAELLTNGNFAAWTGDNPDAWAVAGEVGADPMVTEVTGAARVFSSATANSPKLSQNVLVAGSWYSVTLTVVARASGQIQETTSLTGTSPTWNGVGTATKTARSTGTSFRPQGGLAPTDITIDDASVKAITLASMLGSTQTGPTDYTAQVPVTLTAGTQCGLALNINVPSAPTSMLVAYHDGTNAKLDQLLNGTWTSVISAAATYGAGRVLKVVKNSTSVSLYYNAVQIGTTSTINTAFNAYTSHALFSSYASNSFGAWSVA